RFLNAITLGPRLWSSTSAATEAPATVGVPSTGVAPPNTSTSPSCTIVPTSPAILPISSTSSGTTRYCRPPVLMTANIVFFLRVQHPSLERTRRGFLSVGYGLVSGRPDYCWWALPKQTAREIPRRVGRTYSHGRPRVKEIW